MGEIHLLYKRSKKRLSLLALYSSTKMAAAPECDFVSASSQREPNSRPVEGLRRQNIVLFGKWFLRNEANFHASSRVPFDRQNCATCGLGSFRKNASLSTTASTTTRACVADYLHGGLAAPLITGPKYHCISTPRRIPSRKSLVEL